MWANDQLSNELKAYYVPEDRKPKEAELLTASQGTTAGAANVTWTRSRSVCMCTMARPAYVTHTAATLCKRKEERLGERLS